MTAARKFATCAPWPREWCGGPARPHGPAALTFEFECVTANEANGSTQRWQKVHRRELARELTIEALSVALTRAPLPERGPWCVRLVRISPSRMDDDAVAVALKTVRDTIAAALHLDDGDPALAFAYAQDKGRPMGVRVEVWGGGCSPAPALRGGA